MSRCESGFGLQVLSLALLLTAMPAPGFAQQRGLAKAPLDCQADRGELPGVVGRVIDQTSGEPVPRVEVFAWFPTSEQQFERSSDGDGEFRLCSLGSAGTLLVQAVTRTAQSPVVTIEVEAETVKRLDLVLVTGLATASGDPGRVVGRIVTRDNRQAIEGVLITLVDDGATALTDVRGHFSLSDVLPGEHALEMRHIAYGVVRDTIAVPAGGTLDIEVQLAPVAIELEPIVVTMVRDPRLEMRGFYERRRWGRDLGLGHFLDVRDIDRLQTNRLSHLFAEIPSLSIEFVCPLRCKVPVFRSNTPRCRAPNTMAGEVNVGASVYLDGVRFKLIKGGEITSIDDVALPIEIAAIEVYSGLGDLPGEFADVNAQRCGAVAIWTRSGPVPGADP